MAFVRMMLYRDGPTVPWGFKLVGGVDCNNTPLRVQKVNWGSPASDAGLRSGDVLTSIGNFSAPMTHATASGIIKNAGNNLHVGVSRGDIYRVPKFDTGARVPHNNTDEYLWEKARETEAIIKQTYRTLPLIEPRPKVRRDWPTGSYLRHMEGPTWHSENKYVASMYKSPQSVDIHQSPTFQLVQEEEHAREYAPVRARPHSPVQSQSFKYLMNMLK